MFTIQFRETAPELLERANVDMRMHAGHDLPRSSGGRISSVVLLCMDALKELNNLS